MRNKKKILLLILLALFVVTAICLCLMPHSKTNTVKKPIKDKLPQTNIDNSDKDAFHYSKNSVAQKYNDFCFKHGIIGNDDPNFDKSFDLDHSGYDCDESEKTTKQFNKETETKLVSLYDSKNLNSEDKNLQKSIVFVTDKEIDIPKEELKQEPKTIVTQELQQEPIHPFVPKETYKEEIKPAITPIITPQPQVIVKESLKKQEMLKTSEELKFIIDTIKSKLTSEFKSSLNLKEQLNEVIPNLNIAINQLDMSNNAKILEKLSVETIDINVKGKIKTMTIKDLLLKHKIIPTFNGTNLTEEQLSLYNKYQTTTDLDIKFHAVKSLMDLGIDINKIKEEI